MAKNILRIILVSFVLLGLWEGYRFVRYYDPEIAQLKSLYERDTDVTYPLANPYSDAKYELGKMLFFDPRLSDTDAISCATCHNPAFSWTDGLPRSKGKGHQFVARKSMSLLNLAWDEKMLWDGQAESLEDQVMEAMQAPNGMSNEIPELLAKLQSIPEYRALFKRAFEHELERYHANNYINTETLKAAIATFERNIVSGMAPFDDWVEGDEDAISQSAKRGFLLFNGKAKCADCHSGWRFSDGKYYDLGLAESQGVPPDPGRGRNVNINHEYLFAFKAVGLRNIAVRAPYMHNGRFNTLEEVIAFYNNGGEIRRNTVKIQPLNLSEREQEDLISFLKTLTSEEPAITPPLLPR